VTDHPALDTVASLDAELLRLEYSAASLPARLALTELADKAAEHQAVLASIDVELGPLSESLAKLEEEVAMVADRRAVVEARLASSTGASRDLVAMDAERQHLAERQRGLEDDEILLMERVEPLESRRADVAAMLVPLEAAAVERRAELVEQEAALAAEMTERRTRRDEAVALISPGLLKRYDAISRSVGGVGAARLVDGRCGGCHLALASAEIESLKKLEPEAVGGCEQCGRILLRPGQFAE
jgi:predicted  nucleic acid-binding Zn-ribbon protein